jgi:hypothetical protein
LVGLDLKRPDQLPEAVPDWLFACNYDVIVSPQQLAQAGYHETEHQHPSATILHVLRANKTPAN